MLSALRLRRASAASGLLRGGGFSRRRGYHASSSSSSSVTGGRLVLQPQHPQQQQLQQGRRLVLATGATVCTLTAYTAISGQPAKADAALAADAQHASGYGTNVTIQTRPLSPPEAPATAEGEGVEKRLMTRHGTVIEEEGEEGHHGHVHAPTDKINEDHQEGDAEEEEDETEEDRRYDAVELEETDCPLCHFMRASACGRAWGRWEKCIHFHKEKEEDFVGPCSRVTLRLAQCIERHKAGFPPMLRNALMGAGDGTDKGDDDEEEAAAEEEKGGGEQVTPAAPETATALAATGPAAAEAKKQA